MINKDTIKNSDPVSSLCVSWNGPVSKAPVQLPLRLARPRDATRRADRQTGRREAAGDRKSFRMRQKEAAIRQLPEAHCWVKRERARLCLLVRKTQGLEGYSPALSVPVASKTFFSVSAHPKNNSKRHSTPKNTWSDVKTGLYLLWQSEMWHLRRTKS